jgi:hypothetical protein
LNYITFSLFKSLETIQTFPNMRVNTIIKETSIIIDILEDIIGSFSSSMNLRSNILIRLHNNSGGN